MLNKYFMLILCALNIQPGQRCRLNTRSDFGEPLPVILKNGQLLEPSDKFGNIDIEHGEALTLSCEGGGYLTHPHSKSNTAPTTANITCEMSDTFRNDEWLETPAMFSLFRCSYPPDYTGERTNRTCFEGNPVIEVGYRIQNQFYPVYESCFNEASLTAVYSKYSQKSYNAMFQTRVDRPYFISGGMFGLVPVETLFSPRGLKGAVTNSVGPMADRYVTPTQSLSRGHLAAKTDFAFAFGQRATFHYVNCAPQWTGFNGGNWNTLEVELRNHIHNTGIETVIYTGTYGVTQLTNRESRNVDIHLYVDENNNPVIPVPLYYYKVVFEPRTQRAVAFVGINNPYLSLAEAQSLFFCQDVCRGNSAFSWLIWHPDSPNEGYSFCCAVPDFRNTIHHLPYFEVKGLLT